jgi:hypothetical protein
MPEEARAAQQKADASREKQPARPDGAGAGQPGLIPVGWPGPDLLGLPAAQRRHAVAAIGRLQGNRQVQRVIARSVIQRSDLSEELGQLWMAGNKGTFFQRLRGLNVSDPDVDSMVNSTLAGDDLWLAHNLVAHGPEASWPIHLKVEREMKGWSDSGGKGVAFQLLRTNGAAPGNADLTATIARVFGGQPDDLWLAQNLQAHGPETSWPIHLRVEREMKGWGDSGGKGVAFQLLRTNGAAPGNADLTATIARVFGGQPDDLWLAQNLQAHGPETSWPIHLRVEREMKGWGDSGGKGAVFTLLRADAGAHAGDAPLTAALNAAFPAGTEDRILAESLQAFGPEASWPVPAVPRGGDIPFDRAPMSSPGERIIFNEELTYPLPHDYHKLVYTATGGGFDAAGGAASKTINGLTSGNLNFFIDAAWTGATAVTVRCDVKTRSTDLVVSTLDWTFSKKTTVPTDMRQIEGAGPVALPGVYTYKLGPDIGAAGGPDYEHQTILERFESRTCNITMAELKPEFQTAHPEITTDADICAHFFGTGSSNGTFTVDPLDQVYDQHGGGIPDLADFQAALIAMKEITCDLPQIYEVTPGAALARFNVRRILRVDGSKMVAKSKVP